MFFTLLIALLSTLFYANILIAEIVNSKNSIYEDRNAEFFKEAVRRSHLKNTLLIIISLFWTTFIIYC